MTIADIQPDTVKRRLDARVSVAGVLQGCGYGVRAPTLLIALTLPTDAYRTGETDWPTLDRVIASQLTGPVSFDDGDRPFAESISARLIALYGDTLLRAGAPVFARSLVRGWRVVDSGVTEIDLALPYATGSAREALDAFIWGTRLVWAVLMGQVSLAKTRELREKVMAAFDASRPGGTNTPRFLEAAWAADIPLQYVSRTYCMYGWGSRQLITQSSVLDTTRNLAVSIARDKASCGAHLRRAGLPGPVHAKVQSWDEARAYAGKIGYPVVVKPSNLDGGVGVSAGLKDERQLAEAWNAAVAHTKSILVEKHCEGEDFRLIVVDGELRWAVGRQPAGVTGDGACAISQLVEQANTDPRRGFHAGASLRPLQMDGEAMSLLAEQDCSPDTVLENGRFIHLRRAANLSSGGTPLMVTDQVHPDNKEMVERAVRLIGLDVAGVDLITPDISRSWYDVGATIIEINAQPQLIAASQTHLYGEILQARIGGDGRIPIVLVLAGEDGPELAAHLEQLLAGRSGSRVGLSAGGKLSIGGIGFGARTMSSFAGGHALLMYREVDALVVVADDASLATEGLPFDKFGTIAMTPGFLDAIGREKAGQAAILDLVLPHCVGDILFAGDGKTGRDGWRAVADIGQLAQEVVVRVAGVQPVAGKRKAAS